MFELIFGSIVLVVFIACLYGGWEFHKTRKLYKQRANRSYVDFSYHPGRYIDHRWPWKLYGWQWALNKPSGLQPQNPVLTNVVLALQRKWGWQNVINGNAANPATGEPEDYPARYAPDQLGVYVRKHPIFWTFWGPIARWLFRERS